MLELAITLMVIAGVIAAASIVPALGLGGKILPGYAFRAKGKEAVLAERALLRSVFLIMMTAAVFLAGFGVAFYFLDWRVFLVLGILFAAITALWVVYIFRGGLKRSAERAKQLSE